MKYSLTFKHFYVDAQTFPKKVQDGAKKKPKKPGIKPGWFFAGEFSSWRSLKLERIAAGTSWISPSSTDLGLCGVKDRGCYIFGRHQILKAEILDSINPYRIEA